MRRRARYSLMVNRFQRALWLAVVVVTLVAFGFAIPLLPAAGPDSRQLAADDVMELVTGTVTLPAGWDVDIASASQRQPVATRGNVQIGIVDAVWLGASSRLVSHAADVVFSQPPLLPDVPTTANGTASEAWQILPARDAPSGDPRRVIVLRRDTSVILVIVRGPAADVAAVAETIDAVVASVTFNGFTPDVGSAP